MADLPFHLFGIRHHGPGCARSLVSALENLQPDCVLIEGPPEAESLLPFLCHEQLVPPVALLVFNPDDAKQAAFYPFAEFSPEWQALHFAAQHQLPVRFMDLAASHHFALKAEWEQSQAAQIPAPVSETQSTDNDTDVAEDRLLDISDPLDWLGRAAGYDSGESWWNHMVEERIAHGQHLELFSAIREAMVTVRAEAPTRKTSEFEQQREQLREASMRKAMRQAQKDGYVKIAVICGAWHLPALENLPSAKADNDLLKALPKAKTNATWVPWSFKHLSYRSGYGAGVMSPEWYQHIWQTPDTKARAICWLTRAAHLLRAEDIDCSSAHIIEAMRLAESLAALRERPQPGLDELLEGLRTTVCMGDETQIQFIEQHLIIGNRQGSIPAEVPSIPLQRDLEQQQKSLRLKPDAAQKILDLDLRQENDLARSHLLHRLALLGIHWGSLNKTGRSSKGSFHEIWTLQWEPQFALDIIQASRWGNSLVDAATARVIEQAQQSQSIADVSQLLNGLLLANLPLAIHPVSKSLEDLAATSSDVTQLLAAIPPLVQIARYGNVRNTDVQLVEHILQSLVPRTAIALPYACQSLDDEAAKAMASGIIQCQQAVRLLAQTALQDEWQASLRHLTVLGKFHGLISGLATRLLFDTQAEASEKISLLMSQALSIGVTPTTAAAWLEGFLNNSGMILLHDESLWQLVNQWLLALNDDYFLQILPLLRRTFSTFTAPERRQLGERAGQEKAATMTQVTELDHARAELSLPLIRQLLGLPS
jgi:hypothetical protein